MNESPQDGASISPTLAATANGTIIQQQQQNQKVQPQKLELILNPEDGSLQTAPLLYVVTACTDSLYRDIYDMAHGDVQIIGGGGSGGSGVGPSSLEGGGGDDAARRKDKMSNLSFAARRHELSYRLASHSKALTHVAALTASNNNNNGNGNNNSGNTYNNIYSDGETANLARFVDVSTKALTHARTAWIQNDECQDAMYFFHGRLFSLRAGPHDVYGALDFMVNKNYANNTTAITTTTNDSKSSNNSNSNSEDSGNNKNNNNANADATSGKSGDNHNNCTSFWYDLPSDLKLETDRYETSAEQQWSKQEVSDRWQMAVRRKLLLGEVGWMAARQQQQQHHYHHQPGISSHNKGRISLPTRLANKIPWKISLKGGIVRLMHGKPKKTIDNTTGKTKTLYPLEAVLTVLTMDSDTDKDADKDKDTAGQDSGGNTTSSGNGNGTSSSTATTSSSSTSQQQQEEEATKKPTGTIIAEDQAEWTLISVDVCAQAKTGQSNHQLDTTNKQRYNLHRLCALAMAREEKQNRLQKQQQQQQQAQVDGEGSPLAQVPTMTMIATVARPLNALFRVAQYFSLSWQLEILSEQAKALSKGNWGSGGGGAAGGRRESRSLGPSVSGGRRIGGNSSGSSHSIVVTPVKFFENRTSRILGVLSISFWAIDDRYGPPSMGDLVRLDEDDDEDENKSGANGSGNDSVSTVSRSVQNPVVTNMLTLSVRAEPDVGIKVSLSGADSIMEFATHPNHGHVRSTIGDLLEATANPFALSASEALLAATILCAERKCYAMVDALPSVLPNWITLTVEKGNIVVAAKIQYYTNVNTAVAGAAGDETTAAAPSSVSASAEPVVLFRLACDSRTGSFVPTFSRSTPLLQHMACNDVRAASDTTLLRIANLSKLRRSRTPKAASAGAVFGSGRVVRDAFDSLSRSMNVLGQRTGVGGAWKDLDDRSTLLRQRAIGLACRDVNVSLMSCCGMAVLYGLSAVSIGVATGIEASPEMAGGKPVLMEITKAAVSLSLDTKVVSSFLLAPPPSLLIDQKLVEHASWTSDGERLKKSLSEQERFGICCSVDETFGLTLYGAEIKTEIESPSSIPTRKEFELVAFASGSASNQDLGDEPIAPPTKRAKTEGSNAARQAKTRDLIDEVEYFAAILSQTIGI
jgi:hypothetical protein